MRSSDGLSVTSAAGVGLGQHGHRAGAGVDAALRLGGGHALHAVAAGLEAQLAVDAVGGGGQAARAGRVLQPHDHFLEAAEIRRALAHDLAAPALALGVAQVHAQQVGGEQRRLLAAAAGADLDEGRARVVRVARQQRGLQRGVQRREVGVAGGDLVARHRHHLGVVVARVQHLLRGGAVGLALGEAAVQLDDLRRPRTARATARGTCSCRRWTAGSARRASSSCRRMPRRSNCWRRVSFMGGGSAEAGGEPTRAVGPAVRASSATPRRLRVATGPGRPDRAWTGAGTAA